MSDLISRKALIKELNELWRYVNFDGDKDVFDIIMKAKAIEQGEVVAWMNKSGSLISNEQRQWQMTYVKYGGEFTLVADMAKRHDIPLYTTPQPVPSADDVRDAILSEASEWVGDNKVAAYIALESLAQKLNLDITKDDFYIRQAIAQEVE